MLTRLPQTYEVTFLDENRQELDPPISFHVDQSMFHPEASRELHFFAVTQVVQEKCPQVANYRARLLQPEEVRILRRRQQIEEVKAIWREAMCKTFDKAIDDDAIMMYVSHRTADTSTASNN